MWMAAGDFIPPPSSLHISTNMIVLNGIEYSVTPSSNDELIVTTDRRSVIIPKEVWGKIIQLLEAEMNVCTLGKRKTSV